MWPRQLGFIGKQLSWRPQYRGEAVSAAFSVGETAIRAIPLVEDAGYYVVVVGFGDLGAVEGAGD
jgi:hypothetical protein